MSLYSLFAATQSDRTSQNTSRALVTDIPPREHLTRFHERIIGELQNKTEELSGCESTRECPKCSDRFLQLVIDGVTLEYCQTCHSWWFDNSEFLHFTDLSENLNGGGFVDCPSTFPCPVCRKLMLKYQLQTSSNLLVHACTDHGIFLQDGEFERAIKESERIDGLAGHLNDEHLAIWRQLQFGISTEQFVPSRLECIECGDQAITVTVDGIELDYCIKCESCWFDSRELLHFTGKSRDIPGDYLTSRETDHLCPCCGRHLRLYQFHPRSNVTVEACPRRHGVYLRQGQFPKVLKVSE